MKHHDPAAIRRAKIIRTIVMVFLCVLSLLPFYLMFVNGTRTSNEVKSGISFWFGSNLLENLHNFDLKQRGLGVTALGSMVNSLLVTVPATGAVGLFLRADGLRHPCLRFQAEKSRLGLYPGGDDGAHAGVRHRLL